MKKKKYIDFRNEWIICKVTPTDDEPMISKSIIFNKELNVTINFPREEFVNKSECLQIIY